MRSRILFSFIIVVLIILIVWGIRIFNHAPESASVKDNSKNTDAVGSSAAAQTDSSNTASTSVYAHNLLLHKGPNFRFYVRWLHGVMTRTHQNVNPSFDDPDSFLLDIKTGVLRANIGDITNFLNTTGGKDSPLKNIVISGDGDQIKLTGTVHKIIPLPIKLIGTISAVDGNRIRIRVTKIDVLKIPFKAILGGFHVNLADLFQKHEIPGVEVNGNDILFDTQKLLPPPHFRGQLSSVRIVNPDLEEIYGNAQSDVERVEQWRNFLRLRDGTIDFGKLTMKHVDLIMIDVSKDAWFDLDLNNYQAQLVNGYTRMTPQAGLQIFMPDRRELPQTKETQNISIEWFKNRNAPPPASVMKK